MDNDILIFRPFRLDDAQQTLDRCRTAAIDKLQTLFPGKRITASGDTSLVIESDSLYADSGLDTYVLGLVDDDLPAMQNQTNGNVITFRLCARNTLHTPPSL